MDSISNVVNNSMAQTPSSHHLHKNPQISLNDLTPNSSNNQIQFWLDAIIVQFA